MPTAGSIGVRVGVIAHGGSPYLGRDHAAARGRGREVHDVVTDRNPDRRQELGRIVAQIGEGHVAARGVDRVDERSEEHTSELQSLMSISYAVFCLKKKKQKTRATYTDTNN